MSEPVTRREAAATAGDGARRSARDYAFAAYDRADQQTRHGTRLVREQVRSEPLLMAALALVIGFVLGLVLRKKV